jgi:hypothetical protein
LTYISGVLLASRKGNIAKMKELLSEGASVMEVNEYGQGVFIYATCNSRNEATRWLLTEAGASLHQEGFADRDAVWDALELGTQSSDAAELSSLLKVMVMLQNAPAEFVKDLTPPHAELCRRGRVLRAELSSYL